MPIRRNRVFFLPGLLFLASCSPKADIEQATKLAEHIHEQLRAGQYEAVYQSADPDFRSTATLDAFARFETTVTQKLGALQSAELADFHVLYGFRDARVRLDYNCVYENGQAKEVFEIRQRDNKSALSAYRIDSPLLPESR